MTKNPHLSSYLWNESQRVSIKETDRYFIRESYKYLLQECLPFTLRIEDYLKKNNKNTTKTLQEHYIKPTLSLKNINTCTL